MPTDAKPVIDGPGVYLLRGGGYGDVVSVRRREAIGWLCSVRTAYVPMPGAWRMDGNCTLGYCGDDILGPVTEPVPPPGMEWEVAGVMAGGVPLWRVGRYDIRDFRTLSHQCHWVFYDDSRGRGSMPLHAAMGRLWAAAMEGK